MIECKHSLDENPIKQKLSLRILEQAEVTLSFNSNKFTLQKRVLPI